MNAVTAFADTVSPVEREGLLFVCLSPRNAMASSSITETPPMEMFKGFSGAGALLKGEDMVAREGGDLIAR